MEGPHTERKRWRGPKRQICCLPPRISAPSSTVATARTWGRGGYGSQAQARWTAEESQAMASASSAGPGQDAAAGAPPLSLQRQGHRRRCFPPCALPLVPHRRKTQPCPPASPRGSQQRQAGAGVRSWLGTLVVRGHRLAFVRVLGFACDLLLRVPVLSFDLVEQHVFHNIQASNDGKPDHPRERVVTVEESQAMASASAAGPGQDAGAPPSSLQRQGSLTLPRTLSAKTVDEVWRNLVRDDLLTGEVAEDDTSVGNPKRKV
ncbi:hypothetical protein QYE76_025273 [Lolium multiflorum]|uniref:Uncharacterized protein n=1 Tax=Lolium multiflorum TaxID=4521 RepID=A0AAD8RFC3_LOLMU|nr:hypothetical protein QYE76_025273 [Lolium multiflorum]